MRALERGGFVVSHVRGSHFYLRHRDGGALVVVPVHRNKDLPVGTLRSILRQAALADETFIELLNR